MGYRIEDKKPPKPRRDVQGTTSPSKVFVQNGSTLEYAIPCWYLIVDAPVRSHCHSRDHHDHIGWPSPTHPDHICQDWEFAHCHHRHENIRGYHHDHCDHYIDMRRLHPIHLIKEGYEDIDVVFHDKPDGLEAYGEIDKKRDWIIRITVESLVEDAITDKVEVPYSIFASCEIDEHVHRDVVSRGVIVILPGPIGVTYYEEPSDDEETSDDEQAEDAPRS